VGTVDVEMEELAKTPPSVVITMSKFHFGLGQRPVVGKRCISSS